MTGLFSGVVVLDRVLLAGESPPGGVGEPLPLGDVTEVSPVVVAGLFSSATSGWPCALRFLFGELRLKVFACIVASLFRSRS